MEMFIFEDDAKGCTPNGLQFLKPKNMHQQKIEARQCLFLFEKTSLLEICRSSISITLPKMSIKGVVNCQNSRDKGPPEGNSARG